MNGKDLIDSIHNLYQETQTNKRIGKRIFRGTGGSIATQAEDLFALWLDSNISDKSLKILVNTRISLDKPGAPGGRKKPKMLYFKPDICVIDSRGTVRLLCELKMDMGYVRDFTDYAWKRSKELDPYKGGSAHFMMEDKEQPVFFPETIIWHYIVFSEKNIGTEKRKKIEQAFREQNAKGRLFILSRGEHLNKLKAKYLVDNVTFEALEKITRSL